MNFLQETRLFSILSVILLATILLGTFIFLNILFSNFEEYYTNLLYERHKVLLKLIEDNSIENLKLYGEPLLLGTGIISTGEEKFYPEYIRLYWNISKKYLKDFSTTQTIKPLKKEDLYFQVILSPYKGKTFVSIYDATTIGFIEEKVKILSIFVIATSIILPLYLYLFLKRAGKLYYTLLKEARENPLVSIYGEEPDALIEHLKKTNEELKILLDKEKERFSELELLSSTLSNNIPSGLIILDNFNKIVEANENILKVLKIENLEEKKELEEFFSNYPNLLKNIKEFISFKKPNKKRDIVEKDKNFNLTVAPLYKNSNFLGTLILIEDISEIKRLENILIEKENLASLGTFSAGIAHEFRNSLSTIIGYAKLLKKSQLKIEEQNYLESLLNESKHLSDVITSFLEYTKIKKLEREKIEITEILKKAIEPLKLKYPKIRFILKGNHINLNVDLSLFTQGLRAILENSCYEQKEGDIFLNYIEDEKNVIIEIRDQGSGMDEETLKKAFIPFFSTKPDGTGLGLSLAHKVITLHNGTISISSKKGFGTTIKITIQKEVLLNDTL